MNREKMVDFINTQPLKTVSLIDGGRESLNELPPRYGKAQKRPYIKSTEKDLETDFTYDMLNRIKTDLHNVLWGGGGTDDNEVFASLTNLILSKIQDEYEKEDGEAYDFQSFAFTGNSSDDFETNEQLFERVNELYRRALQTQLYITEEAELAKSYVVDTKKFSLSKLKYTVQKLEGLSFIDGRNSFSDKDILGDFFEGIIRTGFKQSKGQFFTHINIVKFMLWGMQVDKLAIKRIRDDRELPYMIDPAAGSGTFLLEYMKFITQNIKYRFRNQIGTSRAVTDKLQTWFYPDYHEHIWAKDYIYASELNFNLGSAIKVNMILHGDGSTNVFIKDGLLPFAEYEKETGQNILANSHKDELYNELDANGQFDLILTNPPFSVNLDNDTKKTLRNTFMFGDKKNSENLFVERWYQLLRENGRLAAILPESIFDIAENKYIRLFLFKYFKIKAVVSLPQLAFQPFTPTKTSILFAQKKTKFEIDEWNRIWAEESKEYSALAAKAQNLLAVNEGKKERVKSPSISNLSPDDEITILRSLLVIHLTNRDNELGASELIEKYRDEIVNLCRIDKETQDTFGYVNTWWVFSKVATRLGNSILMADAENIGYKRTSRSEKGTPNDLYRESVDADENKNVLVDDGIHATILDYMRDIVWD